MKRKASSENPAPAKKERTHAHSLLCIVSKTNRTTDETHMDFYEFATDSLVLVTRVFKVLERTKHFKTPAVLPLIVDSLSDGYGNSLVEDVPDYGLHGRDHRHVIAYILSTIELITEMMLQDDGAIWTKKTELPSGPTTHGDRILVANCTYVPHTFAAPSVDIEMSEDIAADNDDEEEEDDSSDDESSD